MTLKIKKIKSMKLGIRYYKNVYSMLKAGKFETRDEWRKADKLMRETVRRQNKLEKRIKETENEFN